VGAGGPKGGQAEIAVTMFLQHAEHGTTPSGYVAEAINFYLDRKYGRPFQGWATPRHRLPRGLRINWDWTTPVEDPPIPLSRSPAPVDPAQPPAVEPDTAQARPNGGPAADS
jgi:hypothetical protein